MAEIKSLVMWVMLGEMFRNQFRAAALSASEGTAGE
jgi:hypothetical protein